MASKDIYSIPAIVLRFTMSLPTRGTIFISQDLKDMYCRLTMFEFRKCQTCQGLLMREPLEVKLGRNQISNTTRQKPSETGPSESETNDPHFSTSLPPAMLLFWSFSLGLLSLLNILGMSSFLVCAGEPSGGDCQTLRQRREW